MCPPAWSSRRRAPWRRVGRLRVVPLAAAASLSSYFCELRLEALILPRVTPRSRRSAPAVRVLIFAARRPSRVMNSDRLGRARTARRAWPTCARPGRSAVCGSSPPRDRHLLAPPLEQLLAPSPWPCATSLSSILPSQATILSRPLSIGCADLLDDPDELVGDAAEPGELGEEGDHDGQRVRHRLLDLLGRALDLAGGDRRDRVDERGDDRADLAGPSR